MERERFYWLNDKSQNFLNRGYMPEGISPKERIRQIADRAEEISGIEGFSDKFYDYMARGFFSLSSPVWANYGTNRGMPVSCFGSYVDDNMASIIFTQAEVGILSKMGGGTSGYMGALRPRGATITDNGASSGAAHFTELFEVLTKIISQGSVRRGFYAPYFPIDHDDFDEVMKFREWHNPIQKLTFGITITDDFMYRLLNGDEEAERRWEMVLRKRFETGVPYIFFEDNVNRDKPDVYREENAHIYASNMCTEIALPSNEDETFVCVLSSLNLENWDEIKQTDAVETLTIFLDTVCEEFLQKIEQYQQGETAEERDTAYLLRRVYNFAKKHRALGMGVLGWHSYLQKWMLPFDSEEANKINESIFSQIQDRSYAASERMARMWGEPEMLKGYGRRNTTTMAIAPTKSSSYILGQVSMGIEPLVSNMFILDLDKTDDTHKNPYLVQLLEEKGQNTPETWLSIQKTDGSVQHLDCLSDHEKAVFKTWVEIDQMALIKQAATRQRFIDQGQSLNLRFPHDVDAETVDEATLQAWEWGVKTLYYQYAQNAAQQYLKENNNTQFECVGCEG